MLKQRPGRHHPILHLCSLLPLPPSSLLKPTSLHPLLPKLSRTLPSPPPPPPLFICLLSFFRPVLFRVNLHSSLPLISLPHPSLLHTLRALSCASLAVIPGTRSPHFVVSLFPREASAAVPGKLYEPIINNQPPNLSGARGKNNDTVTKGTFPKTKGENSEVSRAPLEPSRPKHKPEQKRQRTEKKKKKRESSNHLFGNVKTPAYRLGRREDCTICATVTVRRRRTYQIAGSWDYRAYKHL